jgi:thiamine-phosphate pyrophosphorylase
MKALHECRLYAFVDTAYLRGRDPLEVGRQLCEGGADILQLRAKGAPPEEIRRLAETLLPMTTAAGVPLVINDHPAIASEVGASFCHLGQEDFFDAGYRHCSELQAAGIRCSIGLSTHAPEQARRALLAEPAYLAVGPVYPTPTKPGRPAVTLDYVRWAAAHIHIPWFAIGGITLETLDEVLAAGARRICVVSAILNRPDVAAACREFRRALGV